MEWAIHPILNVQFNEARNTPSLKCAVQYNCKAIIWNSMHHKWGPVPQCSPSEDKIAWYYLLIFKALDQRFQKFQLGIEYFRKLFWTVEFYRNENRGEGMNISGFSQTSPKIQFRALRSVRGRENSHISYIGDNFFRSQIAPLSSFHIYWLNNQ